MSSTKESLLTAVHFQVESHHWAYTARVPFRVEPPYVLLKSDQLRGVVYAYVASSVSTPDEVAELLERRTCVVPVGAGTDTFTE